tara:strand:- start:517 stop:921 length:405 start_codon:yes stop_codon:yes gene_type:complete
MVVRITILILFLISFNDVRSDNPVYNVFQDFVQFSSSVDTYSDVCIRDFDQDKAKRDLFDLINEFRKTIELSELQINKLKEKYFRINQSTRSQLIQLGLMKEKNLCQKYLKIFERFDNKKNEKLMKIIEIIDES